MDTKYVILIVIGALVIGGIFGALIKPDKIVSTGINKTDYCYWVKYAQAEENLMISQSELLHIYNPRMEISTAWDKLQNEVNWCNAKD